MYVECFILKVIGGCVSAYFEGHWVKPLTGLTGVRQKGGLPKEGCFIHWSPPGACLAMTEDSNTSLDVTSLVYVARSSPKLQSLMPKA